MRYNIETLGSGSDLSVEQLIEWQKEKGHRCKILSDEGDKVPGRDSRNRKTVLLIVPSISQGDLLDFEYYGGIFIEPITNLPDYKSEQMLQQHGRSTAEYYFRRKRTEKAKKNVFKYKEILDNVT